MSRFIEVGSGRFINLYLVEDIIVSEKRGRAQVDFYFTNNRKKSVYINFPFKEDAINWVKNNIVKKEG